MSTCGLATTSDITVHYNIAIRPEFVRYALVACDVEYVRPLVITLSIAVCCNTAIRPESVHCALMTCGQTFVCCLATTLGIAVRCDTAIRLEFVHCVLAVIRLVPIFRALQIRISLSPQTEVRVLSTYSHRSDLCPPWDGYTHLLGRPTSCVGECGAPLLLIFLMVHRLASC